MSGVDVSAVIAAGGTVEGVDPVRYAEAWRWMRGLYALPTDEVAQGFALHYASNTERWSPTLLPALYSHYLRSHAMHVSPDRLLEARSLFDATWCPECGETCDLPPGSDPTAWRCSCFQRAEES